ncbi:MAG TPA: MATE family efflux transporter [Mangrovimonas sp.]|nr:MATE family efflux transporter [Mangrovimonas sp.]
MSSNISFKHISKLAIPALISGVSEPILSLTDAAVLGNVKLNPTEELAAVGIVTTFMSMLIWVLGQTRSALASIISQYVGANNIDHVKNLPAQAIMLITSLSLVIIALTYPFATYIFKFYNASQLILDYCVEYYRIRVFGFPFTLFTIAVFGTFRGLQNTFYPMIIALIGTVTNIVLDFLLVYGYEDLVPAMHVRGAAYASVIAQILMAIASVVFLLKKTNIPLWVKWPLNQEIKRFLLMIAHLFVRTLALNVTLYLGTSYSTALGKSYIAAYTIGINLWFLAAFVIDGYASAGGILSGKLLGAKDYKTLLLLGKKLIRYGVVIGVILGLLGALLYHAIGRIFTHDEMVLTEFYKIFWIILAMFPVCAIAFIYDSIFKGLGEMKTLRNLLLIATFLVFAPVLYLLDLFDWQLYGVFTALYAWILTRSFPLVYIFRRRFKRLSENV